MTTVGASPLLRSGLFRYRMRAAGTAVAITALTVAGLGAVAPASSAPDQSCPTAYPVGQLARGQAVHGLTVSQGTTPEAFTGQVIGVIDDGIALDLDMIMVRLSSAEIDRVGGIWAGMSGSPVYAADGRLIGAVAYGLAFGASPVAGVTPAADMQELLSVAATDDQARSTLRAAGQADDVDIPRTIERRLVSSGAARPAEVEGGMSRLPLPLGISGMVGKDRLNRAAKALDLDDVKVFRAGAASADAPATDATAAGIVAGGNLAASLSYGDLSAMAVGTVTAVCGDEVLAFGHPMSFTGPSTLTMHPADAVFIQEESLGAPFKVANPGAPVGGIEQDRLAGLLGTTGQAAVPDTTDVVSQVAVVGGKSRHGETHISVPAAVPDIAAFHLLANQDRVFDGITGGSSEVSWTVSGTRADGSPFSYSRSDRYADRFDASFAPTFDLFDQLWQLQNNGVEEIRFTTIDERSLMSRDFTAFTLAKVQIRAGGRWRPLRTDRVLTLRAGSIQRFRVTLTSAQLANQKLRLDLRVPRNAARKFGFLEILGGNSFFGEGGFEEGPAPTATDFDKLLRRLERAPRNDDVLANLNLFRRNGSLIKQSVRKPAAAVVDGGVTVEVRVRRAR